MANAKFRNWITPDGKNAPSGKAFKAERGRYHLYVSYACPWAHRTLILWKLKGLEDMISVSVVNHFMGADTKALPRSIPRPNPSHDSLPAAVRFSPLFLGSHAK
jgi:glutathionyl-hydroquinone reductase